ncbi:outer membrane lipoprotein carrier protein LolA [Elusimicrobiota bacterium]
MRRNKAFFLILFSALVAQCLSGSVPYLYAVDVTTTTVLERVKAFEDSIERAQLRFEEEIVLLPTNEKEKISGKVYLDKKRDLARIDYKGGAKAKVFLDKDVIYFYDVMLDQVVIQKLQDFSEKHTMAFMNLPVINDIWKIRERFDFSLPAGGSAKDGKRSAGKGSDAEKKGKLKDSRESSIKLIATPKAGSGSYSFEFEFGFPGGEPRGLKLFAENLQITVTISGLKLNTDFNDSVFSRNFPKDTLIVDLRDK